MTTIFESLYVFFGCEKGYQSSTYATAGEWGSSKMSTAAYRGKGCQALCVRSHLHYLFSCFWQHFVLKVSCFICRTLTLPLFKKDVFVTNGYFSLTGSVSVVIK